MMSTYFRVGVGAVVMCLLIGCGDGRPAATEPSTQVSSMASPEPKPEESMGGDAMRTEVNAPESPEPKPEGGMDAMWCNQVMALQIEGRNSEAMALLLGGRPPSAEVEIPEFFTLSESDFQQLPSDVAQKMMQALPKILDGLLSFAKNAKTVVMNTPDAERKSARAQRLKRFGEELSRGNRVAMLQMIGNSIIGWDL